MNEDSIDQHNTSREAVTDLFTEIAKIVLFIYFFLYNLKVILILENG